MNKNLVWQSDVNGEELGFPAIDVIGVYTLIDEPETYVYINKDNFEVVNVDY